MDISKELKELIGRLEETGVEYALCGGLALAVYARPRATLDIDLMVHPDDLDQVKQEVGKAGFTLPSAPMRFHAGEVVIHRLTKVDENSGDHLVLDLLLVTQTTQKIWDERVTMDWAGSLLTILSPEGLIQLKSLRNSGQDRDDIEYLRKISDED